MYFTKISVITALIIVVLSIASFALSDASTTAIYGTIKVDGKIDDAWENANKEDIVLVDTESDLGGYTSIATNTTGTLRTMWNEEYFYVLVEVDKKDLPLSVHYGMENKGEDNVSVSIGFDGFFGADVFNYSNPYSGVFRVILNGEKGGHGVGFDSLKYNFIGKMAKISNSSYAVEYAFEWPKNGFTLYKESVIALDIQINVAEYGKRIGVTNWSSSPATTWQSFLECGTVYLDGIENMNYPSKTTALPSAKPGIIECAGDIGYVGYNMASGSEAAARFNVPSGSIEEIAVECPSWGDNYGQITLRLYKWLNDYGTTVSQSPIAAREYRNFPDNTILYLDFDEDFALSEGEYLLWIGDGSDSIGQGVGVYVREYNATDPRMIATYIDGKETNKLGLAATVYLNGAEEITSVDTTDTEETTAEETTVEETAAEETTVEETTAEETTAEDATAEETTAEETTAEETTAEETTAEEETTDEEGAVAPPTADYMAIAALAAIACGVVLVLGKKK